MRSVFWRSLQLLITLQLGGSGLVDVPREHRKKVAAQFRTLYYAADLKSARALLQQMVEVYAITYPTVVDKLER